MSIALMTLAFKAALPTTQKFVLVALCDSANDQGECYPSVQALGEKCSMAERTVQAALSGLQAAGYLRREFRKGRSTVYWLHPRNTCTPQQVHPTPAGTAPITVIEPIQEKKKREKRVPVGTRLPSTWKPGEADLAYAAGKGVDAEVEAESFRDHWLADTTPKALKADWEAAWRTWVRNSLKFGQKRGGTVAPARSFRQADLADKSAEVAVWSGGRVAAKPAGKPSEIIDMEAPNGSLQLVG